MTKDLAEKEYTDAVMMGLITQVKVITTLTLAERLCLKAEISAVVQIALDHNPIFRDQAVVVKAVAALVG